jgi:hypothetical protein
MPECPNARLPAHFARHGVHQFVLTDEAQRPAGHDDAACDALGAHLSDPRVGALAGASESRPQTRGVGSFGRKGDEMPSPSR